MATDKEIKNMHDAKIQRWDNAGISAQIGGIMHDVINIITSDNYPPIDDTKKTAKEIKEWLDILYEIMEDKKYEINGFQRPKPIDENEAIEETIRWQKKYNEECEAEEEASKTNK
jgi:hypothetical protein